MLVHSIKLLEDEITSGTEYNIEVNRNCNKWWKGLQTSCISDLRTKYGLTCDVTFNYNATSLQFLDGLKYTRVEINDKGIELTGQSSYDPGHSIIFDNLSTLLHNYKNIQEDLKVYNSKFKVGYDSFQFKQLGELEKELSNLKRNYERSIVDNIINSGQEVAIDEIIYELQNTYDRVPETNKYIYELREINDHMITLNTGAGKWDRYIVLSIQVMKENKGGKTYEVKCKSGGQPEGFVFERLKKDYLIYAIGSILTLNKHSKSALDEFNALEESEKRIKI